MTMTDIERDDSMPVGFSFLADLPSDAPQWAQELNQNLYVVLCGISRIDSGNTRIEAIHIKILGIVEELKPEVVSVVDGLKSNPMLKMFLGGKK